MSVLDRAIVKAYLLQKSSAPSGSSDGVPPRPLDSSQAGGTSDAALVSAETVKRLLTDDVDAISPTEWESLASALPSVSTPAVGENQPDQHRPLEPELPIECDQPFSALDNVHAGEMSVPSTDLQELVAASAVVATATSHANHSDAPRAPVASNVTLAAPPNPVPALYQPLARSTEVAWDWPEICEQLDQFTGDGFRQLAKHLQFAAGQGHKVLAFVGTTANTGRTSVVLTLTRILALEGRTSALLIDADRRRPQLASLTNLSATAGLCEVLYGQAALNQATVRRSPGLISLLPLRTAVSDAEWGKLVAPLRALVKQARQDYDLVLIDAGVFGPETRLSDCWLRGGADAVITISRQLTGTKTTHDVLNWKQIGIESLGVIETFS